jgi:exodeoxyribonuclease VII large subunit
MKEELNRLHIYTISELTSKIKILLEGNLYNIWVKGEISNLTIPASGHIYFTLKDNYSQIRVVIFRNKANLIRFNLENGLTVILHGEITVYEKRGEYQIIADYIEPAGYGELHIAFEQLKEKLRTEGLFDEKYKKPIPMLPKKIGIITSPTGAAIRDMIHILTRRFQNIEILIYPVTVQGEDAPADIIEAIYNMNNLPEEMQPDVLIVGRGGGSIEDLWAFNDEGVARAIFVSEIPVISAVGHECDFTIADFVADMRAPTPSGAAEMVINKKSELVEKIISLRIRMINTFKQLVSTCEYRLKNIKESPVFARPEYIIMQHQQRIDDATITMQQMLSQIINAAKNRTDVLINKLYSLNPLAILSRGYSITYKMPENRIIKDTKKISIKDKLRIRLHKGEIIAETLDITK